MLATSDRMATDDLSCNHHCTSAKSASQEIDMHLPKHDETSMLHKSHIHGAGEEVGRMGSLATIYDERGIQNAPREWVDEEGGGFGRACWKG